MAQGGFSKDDLNMDKIDDLIKKVTDVGKQVEDTANILNKTKLKVNTDAADIEKFQKALKKLESVAKQNKSVYSHEKYYQSEENALKSLNKVWNKYAQARNDGKITSDLTDGALVTDVLRYANAYEALGGNLEKIHPQLKDFVATLRSMDKYNSSKGYNYTVDNFMNSFSIFDEMKDAGAKFENGFAPAKTALVEFLNVTDQVIISVDKINNGFSNIQNTGSMDGVIEDQKQYQAALERTRKEIILTEEQMKNQLMSSYTKKGGVNDWDVTYGIGINADNLSDIQKYTQALEILKKSQQEALEEATKWQNRFAEHINKGIEPKYDYKSWMNDSVNDYYKYTEQIEYVQERLQVALKTYVPNADGNNAQAINALVLLLQNLNEQIEKIRVAFGTIDDNSDVPNLLTSIQELKKGITDTVTEIGKLSEAFSGVNFNVNISAGSGQNPIKQMSEYGDSARATAKLLKDAFSEIKNITGFTIDNHGMKYLTRDASDLFTELNRISELEQVALTGKFEGKNNLKQQNLALQELIELYKKAASYAGIDLSSWTEKYNNNINKSLENTQKILSGEKQAEESAKQLTSLFGNANNITLSGLTAEIDKVIAKLQEMIDLLSTGLDVKNTTSSINGQNILNTEVLDLESLKNKILEVKNAIVLKNTAFAQEEKIVSSSVQSEINQLQLLHTHLKVILDTLKQIQTIPINLNITGIDGDMNSTESVAKFIDDFKNSLNGLDPSLLQNLSTILSGLAIDESVATNIQKLANAILNLKSNLNNVSPSSTEFLNSIKELVAQGEALKDLANVLKATKTQITQAKEAVKNNSGTKTKESSDSSNLQKDVKDISALENAYNRLIKNEEQYQKLKAYVDTDTATNSQNKRFQELTKLREQDNAEIQEAINLTQELTKEQAASIDVLKNKYQEKVNSGQSIYDAHLGIVDDNKSKYKDELAQTKQLMEQAFNPNISGFQSVFDRAQKEVDELNKKLLQGNISNIQKGYTDQVNKIVSNLNKVVAVADIDEAKQKMLEYANTINNGNVKIGDFSNNNKVLTASFEEQKGVIREVALSYNETTREISLLDKGTKRVKSTLNKFVDGLKARFQSLAQYLMTFVGFYRVFAIVKQGITYVKEFDTALTEMKKVSDETVRSLKNFQDVSFDIASAVGTTAAQIQNSTADFMRLGESLEQAAESAEVANILLNVSEFESIDEATESLVSMAAAYDELEKIEIVDKLNLIGNNFAISTDGLANALQKSASALKTAGNNMDEAIALVTAGNQVVQDPDSVGSGLRTISLRITGTEEAKAELESLGEDTSDYIVQTSAKSQAAIKSFTKVASNNFQGFDILDDNGNFKSTYEILLGISEIYEEIVATDKKYGSNMANGLLETLAGKNRANIAASILQSPEILKAAYDDSSNKSEGSAQKELDKYLDSIEGKIAQFNNEVQEFWHALIKSETIKGFVDIGTKIMDILGNIVGYLGEIGTLATVAGTALGFNVVKKNSGGRAKNVCPQKVIKICHRIV